MQRRGRWALRTSSFTKENHSSKVMTIQANGEKSSIETSINLLKAMLALEAADNLIHILTWRPRIYYYTVGMIVPPQAKNWKSRRWFSVLNMRAIIFSFSPNIWFLDYSYPFKGFLKAKSQDVCYIGRIYFPLNMWYVPLLSAM